MSHDDIKSDSKLIVYWREKCDTSILEVNGRICPGKKTRRL